MKNKKCWLVFSFVLILIGVAFSVRVTDGEQILKNHSDEQIRQTFKDSRKFEWVDKYEVKDDGIFILTDKWYYQVKMEEDGSLFFSGFQSRYEYDRNQVSWILLSIFFLSGIIILIIILSSVKWHGFEWYKRMKKIDNTGKNNQNI